MYSFNNEKPIYIQLVELLELEILSSRLKSGERLPSVREFSCTYKVNPNTMQKALGELEDLNLIYTERTNGKFVTEDKKLIKNLQNKFALEKTKSFVNDMKNIGLTKEEIKNYLEKIGDNK